MEDKDIIKNLFDRCESAIDDLHKKYGKQCENIACKILNNKQDAQECVNDMLLAVWNNIPPESPNPLGAYVYKITRNISLKKYHSNTAKKRNSYYDLVLDELSDSIAGEMNVEEQILAKELNGYINEFLGKIKDNDRIMFVKRYWFLEDISEIAAELNKTDNYVTVRLHRIRKRLKKYLCEKGVIL